MQEPRKDGDASEQRTGEQDDSHPQEGANGPKAYAFDGWGMVPLELDSV